MDLNEIIINKCYYVKKKLKKGLFTENWQAASIFSDYKVILKFLKHSNDYYDSKKLQRLKNEILKCSNLYHSDVERVLEVEVYKDHTYIASEYINGVRLEELKKIKKDLSLDDIIYLMIRTCGAIKCCHENNLIHKNLNPHNIWVILNYNQINSIKVSDFGFLEFESLIEKKLKLYYNSDFISPEVKERDIKAIDERSDIFSLGLIFYWLLTNKLPYGRKKDKEIKIHQILPPSSFNKSIPPILDLIILKSIQMKFKYRYKDVKIFIKDLIIFNTQEKIERDITNQESERVKINDETFSQYSSLKQETGEYYSQILTNPQELQNFMTQESVFSRVPGEESKVYTSLYGKQEEEQVTSKPVLVNKREEKLNKKLKQLANKVDTPRIRKKKVKEISKIKKLFTQKNFQNQKEKFDYFKRQFYNLFESKGNIYLIEKDKEYNIMGKLRLIEYFKYYIGYNNGIYLEIEPNQKNLDFSLYYSLLSKYVSLLNMYNKLNNKAIYDVLNESFKKTLKNLILFNPQIKESLEIDLQKLKGSYRAKKKEILKNIIILFNHLKERYIRVLIVIDDLSSFDIKSLKLLEQIEDYILNLPILIVGFL